ncbi:MAG: hypothetical protein Kow0099_36800 [Candidatus Abyssubacteria bacterium]
MAQTHKNIGDILVEEGVLSHDELEEVLEKSRLRNLPLEEVLFKLGYISRDQLGAALAKAYGCEFIDLRSRRIDEKAAAAVSPETALSLRALPFAAQENTLHVAVAAPFSEHSLDSIVRTLRQATNKEIRVVLCNPGPLEEMLRRQYTTQPEGPDKGVSEIKSVLESIKLEGAVASARSQYEELYDVGQTALIAARSHPFGRAVSTIIEEARAKLADSRKYAESGFEEEAVGLARRAVTLLKDASVKADEIEKDWEKLVQQVKNLRAKINSLEEDGAAEYAPAEFNELAQIRDSLLECLNERNVERLRVMLQQGTVLVEKTSLLSPGRDRSREQVITSLAQMREVIARARKAGAKEYAPEVLKEAYGFLEKAETCARLAQWDEVRQCLTEAESKALEAERISVQAAEEKAKLTVRLRDSIRTATAAFEEALALCFAQEVMEDLFRGKDAISEAKSCFETDDYERGIGLAESAAKEIRQQIIPRALEAERLWKDLFRRADEISARIQSLDIALALKLTPDRMSRLFVAERQIVNSLCERNRENLENAVSACERLVDEIRELVEPVKEGLREAQTAIAEARELLASTAAAGIDPKVAAAYEDARGLVDHALDLMAAGQADAALETVHSARRKLSEDVVERQNRLRETWAQLVPQASDLFRQIATASSLDAMHYCPDLVHNLHALASTMFSALAERDVEKTDECIQSLERVIQSVATTVEASKNRLHESISRELTDIENVVHAAVERCSGSYAPDVLEDAYLDLSRVREQLKAGPGALSADVADRLGRDLAVAKAKAWQVEFLRERFEREREEDLRQLRLKMDTARENIDACARLDFIGEDSALIQKARALLEQADHALIEGDVEGSFELVRQSHAATDQAREQAEEKRQTWRELAESLSAERPEFKRLLSDAATVAPEEYRELSHLVDMTPSIIETKDLDALKRHAAALDSATQSITRRLELAKEQSRSRIEKVLQKAIRHTDVARMLRADEFCPDVFHAAHSYLELAERYLETSQFERAESAARDALAKARDAATLSKSSSERAGALALDYMKIASAHLAEQRLEAANETLRRGLSLAQLAHPMAQPTPEQ